MIAPMISGTTNAASIVTPHDRAPGRRFLSKLAFGLGSIWGVAGAFKVLFGIRVVLPGLPPLGLEQIHPTSAFLIALGCFVAGAALARNASATTAGATDSE